MNVRPTDLPDVIEVVPRRLGDERGWFTETYKRESYVEAGIAVDFIQDNESFSAQAGTIRGLHYQMAPHPQDKLVRVIRGSILDVAVDLRRNSPTFGHHVAVVLSGELGNQLFVPAGFGHGFCTLEPDCRVAYKVSGRYAPECERAVAWNDPTLGIDWRLPAGVDPTLSGKDAVAPLLAEQPDLFDD